MAQSLRRHVCWSDEGAWNRALSPHLPRGKLG